MRSRFAAAPLLIALILMLTLACSRGDDPTPAPLTSSILPQNTIANEKCREDQRYIGTTILSHGLIGVGDPLQVATYAIHKQKAGLVTGINFLDCLFKVELSVILMHQ